MLRAGGLDVSWLDSSAAAAAALRRQDAPVLLSLARGAGALQGITELRAAQPDVRIIAVVDVTRPDLVAEAVLANVTDVLTPDFSVERLRAAIGDAEASREAAVSAPFYVYSAEMRDAYAAMTRAAAGRGGVLLRGESGTGRRLAAAAIHAASPATRRGQFVAVDFAASDALTIEQTLFGTTPRPDEDALPARGLERVTVSSLLHAAIGGTLFLENIQDASTRVQRRLARVLRDREVAVDGSGVAFDTRCMASADETLAAALLDGRVEDALARRLSSVRIDLPPLRNRREDIPALANRFLHDACAAAATPAKMLSRSALALLTALPWRGNTTELRALMATIAEGSPRKGVSVEDLLAHVRLDTGSATLAAQGTLRQARAQFEQEYIASILKQHRGRITQAAKTLGIQRTNLYRKMRTLNVAQPRMR